MGAPAIVLQPSREDIPETGRPLAVDAESATFPSVDTPAGTMKQRSTTPQATNKVDEARGYGALSSGPLWLFDVHQQLSLREQQIHPPKDSRNVSIAADVPISGDDHQQAYNTFVQELFANAQTVGDPCDPETSVSESPRASSDPCDLMHPYDPCIQSHKAAISIVADGPISGDAPLHESTVPSHHDTPPTA